MTITQLYDKHKSGEINAQKFLYEVRRNSACQPFITNVMNLEDTIRVLKHRNLILEAAKPKGTLNIDQVNPYEYRRGLDYELHLCNQPIPNFGVDFTGNEEYAKAQKKVLVNLTKDPLYYTHLVTGQDRDDSQDMVELNKKGDNVIDKKNAVKPLSKTKVKSNVKVNLGKKEAKKGKPKGVKEMTMTPKKSKGVKVMDIPTEYGKTVKLKSFIPKKKGKLREGLEDVIDPETPENILPFSKVRPGMTAFDQDKEVVKVIAIGDYYALKKYDGTGAIGDYLGSEPSGVDGTELIAVKDKYGRVTVQVYGEGGAYCENEEEDVSGEEGMGSKADSKSGFKYDKQNISANLGDRMNENDKLKEYFFKQGWDNLNSNAKIKILLKYVKDPDQAEKLIDVDFHRLPDGLAANIDRELNSGDEYKGDPEFRNDFGVKNNLEPHIGSLSSMLGKKDMDDEDRQRKTDKWLGLGSDAYPNDEDNGVGDEPVQEGPPPPNSAFKVARKIEKQLPDQYTSNDFKSALEGELGNSPEKLSDRNFIKDISSFLSSKYNKNYKSGNISEDDVESKKKQYNDANKIALQKRIEYDQASLQKASTNINENNNMKLSQILKTVNKTKLREDNSSVENSLKDKFYDSPISQPKLEMGQPVKGEDGSYWVEISLPQNTILSTVQIQELMKMNIHGYKFAGINPKSDDLIVAVFTPGG